MSQFDFGIIDPTTTSGEELADYLNQWKTALHSCHSGPTEPDYKTEGMHWLDTAVATAWALKVYDGTDWNLLWTLNPSTGAYSVVGVQPALGFTPVQQGGGASQTADKIYLGWSTGGKFRLQVNTSDLGALALESWVSTNYQAKGSYQPAGSYAPYNGDAAATFSVSNLYLAVKGNWLSALLDAKANDSGLVKDVRLGSAVAQGVTSIWTLAAGHTISQITATINGQISGQSKPIQTLINNVWVTI
jgi:hypothetical protein